MQPVEDLRMSTNPQTLNSAPAAGFLPSAVGAGAALRARTRALRARPELLVLLGLAALLYLWALGRNGWANDYYSAAVRSMSSSWHDFLYASMDSTGVMTVDKPPLSLWVQALSVRAFGYHPLSILVPQALMGVAAVGLVYDLVARRFGRAAGFAGGLALAVTPVTVAVSRHNNPDALLVLCCVAAVWFAVRGLERGRTRELVLAGVCVGLAFETKMLVALVVVPGIALAWLLLTPAGRGRLHAIRQLLAGGLAMLLVGGAWPALVELTPVSQRPWVSGTNDNSVLSLIFGYNGLGRVEGQTGGPGGFGGNMFGGSAGPTRLLNQALGGQAGWLLGFAAVAGIALLVSTRLRARDQRSGWLLAVGGAFATTAVLFSFAGGIFHPYYVSLLAPFAAALFGAGVGMLLRGQVNPRIWGPLAIAAGVIVELVVLSRYPGELAWLPALLIGVGAACALALALLRARAARIAAVAASAGVLLLAPGIWAVDTLSYATSSTFPAGGPQSASVQGPGGFGGHGGFPGARGMRIGGAPAFFGAGQGGPPPGMGAGGTPPTGAQGFTGPGGGGAAQGLPGAGGSSAGQGGPSSSGAQGLPGRSGAQGLPGASTGALSRISAGPSFGNAVSASVLRYTRAHGGGTIAVSSQSSAAGSIVGEGAEVAGIGGFSGRESSVSTAWLANAVSAGRIRWVLAESSGFPGMPGDTRKGSSEAITAVERACTKVTVGATQIYDCKGRAGALLATAAESKA